MRKKLFAVIMSAMMMITFMPAMAFAATLPSASEGWSISGLVLGGTGSVTGDYTDSYVYDGVDRTVAYAPGEGQTIVDYSVWYSVDGKVVSTSLKQATAPTVKAVGTYKIQVTGYWNTTVAPGTVPTATPKTFDLEITKRPVAVTGFVQAYKLTKAYDGKGFSLTDKDFTISQTKDGNGKLVAASGLVAGDTLLLKPFTTKADVGVYPVKLQTASRYDWINPNYTVDFWDNGKELCAVEITKAENAVTLSKTNQTFNIAGKKTTAKKSFNINPKATWGTVKVTKVGGSGYLYLKGNKVVVKKGAKLGTYKLKVKAYVVGTNNWNSAEMIKTINVKIK